MNVVHHFLFSFVLLWQSMAFYTQTWFITDISLTLLQACFLQNPISTNRTNISPFCIPSGNFKIVKIILFHTVWQYHILCISVFQLFIEAHLNLELGKIFKTKIVFLWLQRSIKWKYSCAWFYIRVLQNTPTPAYIFGNFRITTRI